MSYKAINFQEKFGLFEEHWAPKVVAEMNDYQFKVVKVQGDFIWHDHKNTDETFIVIEGDLRIDFRDGAVHLGTGEMVIVPRGGSMPRQKSKRDQKGTSESAKSGKSGTSSGVSSPHNSFKRT